MDNLCHSLAGAALAQAGFARRIPRATILAVVAANIPDVDAFVYFAGVDAATSVAFRRGITHGIPALIAWTLLLSAAGAWIAARWPRAVLEPAGRALTWRDYAPLIALAVVSHPALDWLNNYGVRFLAPFSDRWFYGDTLFIVDPVLLVAFGLGWAVSRFLVARKSPRSMVPARVALAVALAYIAWMKAMSEITRAAAAEAFALADPSPRELMVTPPIPFRYLDRWVTVIEGQAYTTSHWRVTGLAAERHDPRGDGHGRTGADSSTVAAVRATERGAQFLRWSRLPYFLPDTATGTVFVGDMRYTSGDVESWAGIRVQPGATAGPATR